MRTADSHRDNTRGILFMLAASTGFIFNDTLVKLANADLALSQIIVIRGLIGTPFLILIAGRQGLAELRFAVGERLVWWRTIGEMGSTGLYLTALTRMPLANATAILQTLPLVTTVVAALFFAERVGIRRWSAVLIGLGAVVAIIRPGLEGFNGWSLFALGAVFFIALRDMLSRLIARNISALPLTILSSAAVTLLGLAMSVFEAWRPLTVTAILYVIVAAVLLSVSYLFIVFAMRSGEVSVVSPFRYSILLWAIVLQIIVFGVTPDALTLSGSAVLVATGLYTVYRERRVAARAARSPSKQAFPPPL